MLTSIKGPQNVKLYIQANALTAFLARSKRLMWALSNYKEFDEVVMQYYNVRMQVLSPLYNHVI